MVNGRITAEQMEWLEARADELGGNLSAALRQTITDARMLEAARSDFRQLLEEHPEFVIPRNEPPIEDTRVVERVLRMSMSDSEDMELRLQEDAHAD